MSKEDDKDLPVRFTEGAPHPFGYIPPETMPPVITEPLVVFYEEYHWKETDEDGPSVLTPEELALLDLSNPDDFARVISAIDEE